MRYFKIDDYDFVHLKQANPIDHPIMNRFAQMSWNEIWMRPADLQTAEELAYYRERFPMVLAELVKFDDSQPVIAEGAALLPELMHKLGVANECLIYMIPSKEFQIEHYAKRKFVKDILSACDDPVQAFANWMERDHLFAKQVAQDAAHYAMKTLYVDGTVPLETNFQLVRNYLGLSTI
jgi:hypothetical protein